MNISLRFSFRVPTYGKKGKHSETAVQHIVVRNVVDHDDFYHDEAFLREYGADVNKLAAIYKGGALRKIQVQFGAHMNAQQESLTTFTGLSTCQHEPEDKVELNDPRWT